MKECAHALCACGTFGQAVIYVIDLKDEKKIKLF